MKNKLYKKYIYLKLQSGNALITLLFFMVMGITIIASTALVLSNGILSASTSQQGMMAYYTAESGAEDGLLYLLRNQSNGNYTISLEDGQASVDINNGIITSTGTSGNSVRKIQVTTSNNNGTYTITSWEEIK